MDAMYVRCLIRARASCSRHLSGSAGHRIRDEIAAARRALLQLLARPQGRSQHRRVCDAIHAARANSECAASRSSNWLNNMQCGSDDAARRTGVARPGIASWPLLGAQPQAL